MLSQESRRYIIELFLCVVFVVCDLIFLWPVSHGLCILLGVVAFGIVFILEYPNRYGIGASALLGIVGLILYLWIPPQETQFHGWLLPDNVPIPPDNVCIAIPKDAIAVLLGNEGAFTEEDRLLVFTFCHRDILWIKRSGETISINADIFDGRIVAEIRDNEFYLNQNNMFRMKRPDRHRLIVYDQEERECLNAHFLNPKAVMIKGHFELPECPCRIGVTESGIFFEHGTGGIQGACMNILHGNTASYIGCQ
jgi:hypothetical protein